MSFHPLRVLVAGPPSEAADLQAAIGRFGHELRAFELQPETALQALRFSDAEIVVVPRGENGESRLRVIGSVTHKASYPVVAAAADEDVAWMEKAAAVGASAAIVGCDDLLVGVSLEVAWRRWNDYRTLEDALERRATIEQAKGLLMARHAIRSQEAFELLRQQSQRMNRKLVEIADAVVKAHIILSTGEKPGDGRVLREATRHDPLDGRPA
jgi:response regulator NasT